MRAITPLVLMVAASVALGACGSTVSHSTSTPKPGYSNPALMAAHCMRAHGVPNFPDPGPHGGRTVLFSPGSTTPTVDGITFSGPAFAIAEKVCKPFGEPRAGGSAVSAQQKRALLEFASCMRHHGLPRWADPIFPPGGGVMGGGGPYSRNSPALRHAETICNGAMGRQSGG